MPERRSTHRKKVLLEARWESMSRRHEARVDDVSVGADMKPVTLLALPGKVREFNSAKHVHRIGAQHAANDAADFRR